MSDRTTQLVGRLIGLALFAIAARLIVEHTWL